MFVFFSIIYVFYKMKGIEMFGLDNILIKRSWMFLERKLINKWKWERENWKGRGKVVMELESGKILK